MATGPSAGLIKLRVLQWEVILEHARPSVIPVSVEDEGKRMRIRKREM